MCFICEYIYVTVEEEKNRTSEGSMVFLFKDHTWNTTH